jgi:hypothetical protein
MTRAALGAALALVALTAGCDRMVARRPAQVFAPWEEGLTLAYEDPTLEPGVRSERRQQVRVRESRPAQGGVLVTKTFSTLSGQWEAQVLERDGGVRLQTPSGGGGVLLLPEGFPDRVDRWEARGAFNWVVGRAAADLPGIRLYPDPTVGVWVETAPLDRPGPRTRTFYLPDLGEAETLTWLNGRWVTTNILVSRGFTDLPSPAAKPNPGSRP